VVPFNISCGTCSCVPMVCSPSANDPSRERGAGAALFGYTKLYGQVPGGRPSSCGCRSGTRCRSRCRTARSIAFPVPVRWLADGVAALAYADVPDGGSLVVLGLGPIGGTWPPGSARQQGIQRVIGVDLVPERCSAPPAGVTTIDLNDHGDDLRVIRDLTEGRVRRGDRLPWEWRRTVRRARGWRQQGVVCCRTRSHQKVMERAGVDRLAALYSAIDIVRRGGTDFDLRRVRRDGRPDADVHCSTSRSRCGWAGQRLELGAGDSSAADRRGPAGSRRVRHHTLPWLRRRRRTRCSRKKSDGAVKIVFEP